MDDSKIIELFFQRSENAIGELSQKYGKLCRFTANNILGNLEDSEECVNDAYLGVWNAVPPKKPDNLPAFLLKIVRNLSVNRLKYNAAEKRRGNYAECLEELERCVPAKDTAEAECDKDELIAYINEFLASLNRNDRMVFVRRYWFMDSFEDIAKLTGGGEGAVRTRLSRIRKKLKEFLRERGVLI